MKMFTGMSVSMSHSEWSSKCVWGNSWSGLMVRVRLAVCQSVSHNMDRVYLIVCGAGPDMLTEPLLLERLFSATCGQSSRQQINKNMLLSDRFWGEVIEEC
jgi:hypothetical protein